MLGNFQCRGVLPICIAVGQAPIALAVGAGVGCLDIFTLVYHCSLLSPSLRGWSGAGVGCLDIFTLVYHCSLLSPSLRGWSGGAKVLGKLQCRGVLQFGLQ